MTDPAATELIHAQVPLCATLGITADTFRPDEVVLSWIGRRPCAQVTTCCTAGS